jgi:hypothetical protein
MNDHDNLYYQALDAAFDIKGDMGLSDDKYEELVEAYIRGYKQCRAEVKEQIEAVIVELQKIRKDHAGLGIVTALLRGIG